MRDVEYNDRMIESPRPGASTTAGPTYSPRQNYPLALIAGIAAAILGAVAWATVTVVSGFQIGYMAVALGFLVGFAVRLGNGTTSVFAYTGAALALFGCILGNFLSMIGFVANTEKVSLISALSAIDYSKVPGVMTSTFNIMDLVFYAIAVYEGYRFSIRPRQAQIASPPTG